MSLNPHDPQPATGDPARGLPWRVFKIAPGEGGLVLFSGLFFFFLLFGYFLIRPVREAMGVQRSMSDLRILFVSTCAASLVVTLAFGSVVSRLDRSRFIPIAMRGVIVCLIGFAGVQLFFAADIGVWTGYVFYVWLSVINVFMVSVFWAFMVDVWSLEQSKRLFPAIGIGGTLGALLASLFAWQMAEFIGAAAQMLLAAALFEGTVWVMRAIDRRSDAPPPRRPEPGKTAQRQPAQREPGGLGGSWWEGATAIVGSPYLLGIGLYIVLMTVSSTLIYFLQAGLVADASEELESRVALFAQLDMWTQLATLLAQLFVTARLIRWLGVGLTLAVLPLVTLLGFAALAWVSSIQGVEGWQVFAVFATFNALHRASRYAVARPARETLFAVVPAEQKYKAKPIVDVFLYRGGDVAGAGVDRLLATLAVGLGGMAVAAAPLAVLWGGLGVWLAWRQRAHAAENQDQQTRATAAHIAGGNPEGASA